MDYSVIYQICRFPKSNNKYRYSVRKITYNKGSFLKYDTFEYGERNLSKLHKEIQRSNCKFSYIDHYNLENVIIPSTI